MLNKSNLLNSYSQKSPKKNNILSYNQYLDQKIGQSPNNLQKKSAQNQLQTEATSLQKSKFSSCQIAQYSFTDNVQQSQKYNINDQSAVILSRQKQQQDDNNLFIVQENNRIKKEFIEFNLQKMNKIFQTCFVCEDFQMIENKNLLNVREVANLLKIPRSKFQTFVDTESCDYGVERYFILFYILQGTYYDQIKQIFDVQHDKFQEQKGNINDNYDHLNKKQNLKQNQHKLQKFDNVDKINQTFTNWNQNNLDNQLIKKNYFVSLENVVSEGCIQKINQLDFQKEVKSMDFFKKAFKDVQPALSFFEKKSKQAFKDIEQKIDQNLHKNKINLDKQLIQVTERVYWMPYPSNEQIIPLSKALNEKYGENYFIWNVSEHKYQGFPFNNQIADHNFPGYPSPPLSEIFLICKAILNWLQMDNNNIAIVHCQNTRGRSALILSCLLCLNKKFNHPGEALTYYCRATKTRDQKILFPSQQLYLNYFANIMNGLKLNNKPAYIHKIILSEVPKIIKNQNSKSGQKFKDDGMFRPYVQVFKESKSIYNSLTQTKIQEYNQNDISVWFDMKGLEVNEDALLRCKHYQSNEVRFPVFRTMIHTNFIHNNVLRLLKKDIDFTNNVEVPENFFMDIIFIDQDSLKQQKQKQLELEQIQEQQKEQDQDDNQKENEDDDEKQNEEDLKQNEDDEKQKNQNVQKETLNQDDQVSQKKDENQNINQQASLEYIAQSVKQQFGHTNDNSNYSQILINQKIQSSLRMQISRDSSQTSESDISQQKPKKNRFTIVDDSQKQKLEDSQQAQKPKLIDIINDPVQLNKDLEQKQDNSLNEEQKQLNKIENSTSEKEEKQEQVQDQEQEQEEDEEENENNKLEKNEKIDKFLDELDKDEELEENDDDMDDYLAQLENEN
ncbi:C2 domain [Pseudocohnilembus persalinus]|uniref:C2 domain n=1 Tax=Pseudocohnilembus persalinus TaxID=266149 RepID=A0A0V0QPX4_PSEPJ|nr:C2 domain [Pseudocohnilembus persalinus]|eukprot:KRX04032.1 C2 domain [Pseudocohnilembus persalinus]